MVYKGAIYMYILYIDCVFGYYIHVHCCMLIVYMSAIYMYIDEV